jgi:hypothetical protein
MVVSPLRRIEFTVLMNKQLDLSFSRIKKVLEKMTLPVLLSRFVSILLHFIEHIVHMYTCVGFEVVWMKFENCLLVFLCLLFSFLHSLQCCLD